MPGFPFVVIHPDPVPRMTWIKQIQHVVREPVSAQLKFHLAHIERSIQSEIAMRGDDSPTDEECVALLTVRNYLEQCESVIPTPHPYVAFAPKPKTPRKPPMEPKSWEETMDPDEVEFCRKAIDKQIRRLGAEFADNFRAARMWKSSQRKRFSKQRDRGCCGSHDFVVQRWSSEKKRYDLYLLGFNYGH